MLSYRDLKTIQEGNRRNQDVMDLLREVRRLRDLAALVYSALGYMPLNGLRSEDRDKLRPVFNALQAEPAVQEYQIVRKRTEDMEFRRQKAQEQRDVRTNQAGTRPGRLRGDIEVESKDDT